METDVEINIIRQHKASDMINQTKIELPNHVVEITSVDHLNKLLNDFQQNLLIIDFWAPWCGPCRSFAPAFDALQKEYYNQGVLFTKLNVDQQQQIAGEFGIQGIPTTVFIKGKKLVYQQVGMLPKAQFGQLINAVLNKLSNK